MSQPLYLVICGQHIAEYAPERELADMTWAGTIKDLADLQYPSMSRVIEIGTGADKTHEAMSEVSTKWAHQGEALSYEQYIAVELHLGTRAARSFVRAA